MNCHINKHSEIPQVSVFKGDREEEAMVRVCLGCPDRKAGTREMLDPNKK